MKWYEVRTAAFRPLWRRVAVVALVLLWIAIEVAHGTLFWAAGFGCIAAYLIWAFFIAFEDGPAGQEGRE